MPDTCKLCEYFSRCKDQMPLTDDRKECQFYKQYVRVDALRRLEIFTTREEYDSIKHRMEGRGPPMM